MSDNQSVLEPLVGTGTKLLRSTFCDCRLGARIHMLIVKRLMMMTLVAAGLWSSLYAHGEMVESSIAKVTIVVDGMMKSKSGAT